MKVENHTRVSISIPSAVAGQLDQISSSLGCSRSAVCSHLLSAGAADLSEVVGSVSPLQTDGNAVRRPTGRTVEELGAVFDALEKLLHERDIAQWLSEDFQLAQEKDG